MSVRADRVDDMTRGHPPGTRDDGMARRQAVRVVALAHAPAFSEEAGSGCGMDGTVDAATTEQARVGGVDDDVDVLRRDVALNDLDAWGTHGPIVCLGWAARSTARCTRGVCSAAWSIRVRHYRRNDTS